MKNVKTLVVDVGGFHVKCIASGQTHPVRFKSGPKLTLDRMMRKGPIRCGWTFAGKGNRHDPVADEVVA